MELQPKGEENALTHCCAPTKKDKKKCRCPYNWQKTNEPKRMVSYGYLQPKGEEF